MPTLLLLLALAQASPSQLPPDKQRAAGVEQHARDNELQRVRDGLDAIAKEIHAQREDNAEQRQQQRPEAPPNWVERWTFYVIAAGTMIALVSLRALFRQTRATEQAANAALVSSKMARDQLHLTQRADLQFDGATRTPSDALSPQTRIRFGIRNCGPTAAKDVVIVASLAIDGATKRGAPEDLIAPGFAIGGGVVKEIGFSDLGRLFHADDIARVENQYSALRFTLAITYCDVFDCPHTMSCRATYYGGPSRGFVVDETSRS